MIIWSVAVTMIMMLSASVIKVVDRVDGRKTRREVVPPMMRMLTKKLMKNIIVTMNVLIILIILIFSSCLDGFGWRENRS